MKQLLLFLLLLAGGTAAAQTIRYVTPTGTGDGTSWANASGNLQATINGSSGNTQIWVAAGTYKPTTGADRTISFVMKNEVAIYGGFAGTETLLSDRNWKLNISILSGDIGAPNDNSDNSYHVIFNNNNGLNVSAVLDGFTITGGNANEVLEDVYTSNSEGGGMLNLRSSPTINNNTFIDNIARSGGGMLSSGPSINITNCSFIDNKAIGGGGGGAYLSGGESILENCSFLNNTSVRDGGAIFLDIVFTTAINNTFINNQAVSGGAIMVFGSSAIIINSSFYGNMAEYGTVVEGVGYTSGSDLKIKNSIFWENGTDPSNYFAFGSDAGNASIENSIIPGSCPENYTCTNLLNVDPLFVNAAQGDLRLQACSPAINAGINSANTGLTDLDGNDRIVNTTIDMGAYEYNGAACAPLCGEITSFTTTAISCSGATLNWSAFVDPTQWELEYKSIAGGSKWIKVPVPNSATRSVNISGLTPNQNYIWHIRAKCGKSTTKYSDAISFTTTANCNEVAARQTTENRNAVEENNQRFAIKVMPNPSNTNFKIVLNSTDLREPVQLTVTDMLGRVMETRTAPAGQLITLGDKYKAGTYIVRFIQGNQMKQLKLIKLPQ